jgi:PAS domain S-box-containing protein
MSQDDFEDAKQNLDSAYNYLYLGEKPNEQRYYYQYLLKYYQAINNKDSVISVFEKLSTLDNDYYKAQQDEYISRQKAESDIRSTLENEKYLSEAKAQRLRFWYVLIITILLAIILIGILKLYYRKARSLNMLKVKSFSNYKRIRNYEREVSQLKTIFQNEITGFFILDKDKNISYVNARGEMLFKSSSDKILAKTLYEFIDDDFIEVFESGFNEMCESGKNNEVQVKVKNNKDLWINLSISPMYVNDELESILVIAQDISSRMKALDSEKEQKKVLQTLFNSVTESIVLLDGTGIIKLINETGAKRLGKSVEQLLGANYFQIIPMAIREERVLRIKQAVKNRKADIYSENIDSYHTQVSIYPNFAENNEVDYIAEFSIDITDRSLAHEQINSLRQKVLRSQMNPHFIFNSLNAIQSYVLKNDTELAVKYLNSFARLIRMILDGSRFDYISLRKEISLLEHYLELQQLRFGDKFSWTMEVDNKIDTDSCLIPVMLAQPFIENAIEHGLQQLEGKGRVKISYVKHNEIIVFKVSDNGIGRQASMKIQENTIKTNRSLSTNIFKERLFTLNKYSGQKITYDIIDLKDDEGIAKGTMVVINIPITYKSNIM